DRGRHDQRPGRRRPRRVQADLHVAEADADGGPCVQGAGPGALRTLRRLRRPGRQRDRAGGGLVRAGPRVPRQVRRGHLRRDPAALRRLPEAAGAVREMSEQASRPAAPIWGVTWRFFKRARRYLPRIALTLLVVLIA